MSDLERKERKETIKALVRAARDDAARYDLGKNIIGFPVMAESVPDHGKGQF